jgi:hypothetical protein
MSSEATQAQRQHNTFNTVAVPRPSNPYNDLDDPMIASQDSKSNQNAKKNSQHSFIPSIHAINAQSKLSGWLMNC